MSEEWKWYVYILECQDGSYYTGLTWKPDLRYDQHVSGLGGEYTKRHGVKRIAYIEEHTELETARNRERQIKNWNRAKKSKLISGTWKKEW
ncbi:MAG: GIY-YIG nuclease family protein [Candidatus Omnitrophica bacterium]|nr:GIY-YIG nuclease family protein [Candidatus Omnitrophota bacterium]